MKKQFVFLAAALAFVAQQSQASPGSAKEDPATLGETAATVKNTTAATVKAATAATVKNTQAAASTTQTAAIVSGAPSPGPASVNPETGAAAAAPNCPLMNSPNVGLLDATTPKTDAAKVGDKAPVLQ